MGLWWTSRSPSTGVPRPNDLEPMEDEAEMVVERGVERAVEWVAEWGAPRDPGPKPLMGRSQEPLDTGYDCGERRWGRVLIKTGLINMIVV